VVFSFGVNDTTGEGSAVRVQLERSIENLRAILTSARPRYPVLFVGPPPVAGSEQNGRIEDLGAAFVVVCGELDVPYLAVFPALVASPVWMREVIAGDGSHPAAAGYAEFASLVGSWSTWQA